MSTTSSRLLEAGRRPGRGEVRRRQILDAAVRIIGTGGLSSLTHRAVADAAGVPLGSTTYYFKDRDDLLRQTMAYAVEIERARMDEIVGAVSGPPSLEGSVRLLTEIFLDKSVADPLYDLALFEMFLEATRNDEYRPQTREWSALIGEIVDQVLPPTDPTIPRPVALQIVAALIDGLMLESASNQELTVEELADHLRIALERLVVADA
ncbi:TetR family transcriptional regulator [Actinotalea sp. M2MS4P-6]|uniref:TetR/AcrR family transcriptional regulator n=1 Tax=Actinotalea sp. M2MS4P-6 TaxID=2983762 RepID=UPI0021E3E2AA|nr:TetR family transcriptional regulator [Actinotalea sp. M2MS4P-6]MCV2395713.1 TetR family transcriptional regulator [Actinotalea sp. M2MS4P-6]